MKKSISKLFLAPLSVLILASFAMTPVAEAAGAGRGGGGGGGARAGAGGGGGGGARAGAGGGGARQNVQPDNSRADARTNDVRNTSVNNVNVNKNVNVDVDQRGGGWDHPVAGAMVVGGAAAVTAAAIGSMVNTVPTGCVPVNYGGMVYQQCGGTWYQPQGSQFVVVNPPY
jgi:hypothetical protein